MNYGKIKVPYIGNSEIKIKADKFRDKYWDNNLPIDIEKIIDVNLEISIIPLCNLEKMCDTNALITSDWGSLYIDKDIFEDERRQNRLRFCLAHEIGHFILHKDFYNSLQTKSVEDFYDFITTIPGKEYSYLETQANKFAGHLLVPRDLLGIELNSKIDEIKKETDINRIDKFLMKPYIAGFLSKKFGISSESMEIILGEFEFFRES